METGSAEHKQEYFQRLLKQMTESIFFGDFQIWTIKDTVEKLQKDKKEAEIKLENKEFPTAGEGRKGIRVLDAQIMELLKKRVEIEGQNATLKSRLAEAGEYISQFVN